MNADPRLDDFLSRWEAERRQGQAVSADELCADSPELLPELRRRIEAQLALGFMGGTGNGEPGTSKPTAWLARPDTDGPLPAVPGYELLGKLGRGGMGEVFRARQVGLNRIVALKRIRPGGHLDADGLARFRTEAEAIARLQHAHIVQVFEVGEHEGAPFFSMEYCPGGTLAERAGGKPLPAGDAARTVECLAWAVHAAHEEKIVHRDLKPANVLLAADGTPKVADFGLAKKLDGESGNTIPGTVMGTPSYMAPEQAAGRTHDIGPATDVWALGAILYELLTGRPPFRGNDREATLVDVLHHSPELPRRLNPQVPRNLEAVCLKCLRKEPGQRYASAQGLAEDLNRFLRGQPIRARPPSWIEAGWRRFRSRLMLVIALLSASLGTFFLTTYYPRPPAEDAQYRREMAEPMRDLAKGRPVTLIGDAGRKTSFRWATGRGVAETGADGTFTASSAWEPALIELLTDPQVPSYRIQAELRHEAVFSDQAQVGIYFFYSGLHTDQGGQHFCARVAYADRGNLAQAFRGPDGVRGGEASLGLLFYGESRTEPYRYYRFGQPRLFLPPPASGDDQDLWRQLVVDVSPTKVKVLWGPSPGQELVSPALLARGISDWTPQVGEMALHQHLRRYPDLAGAIPDFPLRGPMGIFVYQSTVAVKRFSVDPLANGP